MLVADKCLHVLNLNCKVKEKELFDLFSKIGPVVGVQIFRSNFSGCNNHAIVAYERDIDARYAYIHINNEYLFDTPIQIKKCTPENLGCFVVFGCFDHDSIIERTKNRLRGYGQVMDVKFLDRDCHVKTRNRQTYGLVLFKNKWQADSAVRALNLSTIIGTPVSVFQLYKKCHCDINIALRQTESCLSDRAKGTDKKMLKNAMKDFGNSEVCSSVEEDGVVKNITNTNIIVSNLHEKVDDDYLYDIFRRFGDIISCKVYERTELGGTGYVKFAFPEVAKIAIAVMNNETIFGLGVDVRYSEAKDKIPITPKCLPESPTTNKTEQHHQPKDLLFDSDKCWENPENVPYNTEQYNVNSPAVSTPFLHPKAFPNPNYYGYMYDPSELPPFGQRVKDSHGEDLYVRYPDLPFFIPTLDFASGLFDYVPKSKNAKQKEQYPHEVELGPKYDESDTELDKSPEEAAGGPPQEREHTLDNVKEEFDNYPTYMEEYENGIVRQNRFAILSQEMVDRVKGNRSQRNQMFGQRLFPLVQGMVMDKRMTGVVTGYILERTDAELMKLLYEMNPLQIVVKMTEERLNAPYGGRNERNQHYWEKLYPLVLGLTIFKETSGSITETLLEKSDGAISNILQNSDALKSEVVKMEKGIVGVARYAAMKNSARKDMGDSAGPSTADS